VLVLTADATPEAKHKALSLGARDFLSKPLDPLEVTLRVNNLLETRFLYRALLEENRRLEERVQERTRELQQAQLEILERLARAAEYRDDETGEHVRRVAVNAAHVAEALGLPQEQVGMIRSAAPLHDLGKIGIPDAILRKPAKLTPEEFAVIKTHATIGAELLSGGRSELSRVAERIARSHHERWDGSGYPDGLAGEEIPLEGRIVAVVDVFDALTSERPYKSAWPLEEALAEIEAQAGRQFDPRVVQALLHALEARSGGAPSPNEGSTG
jgi:putative two-component system response regulator